MEVCVGTRLGDRAMRTRNRTARTVPSVRACPLLVACAAGLAAAAVAEAQPQFRTHALTGQAAPGAPAGVVFEYFSSPRVNDAGTIAFWARLGGPAPMDPKMSSIWSVLPGAGPSRVVASGDTAPFNPAFRFTSTVDPAIDAAGGVTFLASFSDAPMPNQ